MDMLRHHHIYIADAQILARRITTIFHSLAFSVHNLPHGYFCAKKIKGTLPHTVDTHCSDNHNRSDSHGYGYIHTAHNIRIFQAEGHHNKIHLHKEQWNFSPIMGKFSTILFEGHQHIRDSQLRQHIEPCQRHLSARMEDIVQLHIGDHGRNHGNHRSALPILHTERLS